MDRLKVIARLNWFYSLELNQVDLYTAQSRYADNLYIKRTLDRVAVIEQQHVDNIADKIRELGGEPTSIGDTIAPITGKIAGNITGFLGVSNILKADIALENKAMSDYKDFILSSDRDKDLSDLLWSNLIDEDLHTAWFRVKLRELQSAKR